MYIKRPKISDLQNKSDFMIQTSISEHNSKCPLSINENKDNDFQYPHNNLQNGEPHKREFLQF